MKKAVLVIVFIALVGVGSVFIFTNKSSAPAPNANSTNTVEAPASEAVATITYANNGFSPDKITVKAGDTVSVKNESSESLQFSSDPHPIHTASNELNLQTIPAGGSMTFKVTIRGTHGFHNHLNSSLTGAIIVE